MGPTGSSDLTLMLLGRWLHKTERPPRGGLSEIRSGDLVRRRRPHEPKSYRAGVSSCRGDCRAAPWPRRTVGCDARSYFTRATMAVSFATEFGGTVINPSRKCVVGGRWRISRRHGSGKKTAPVRARVCAVIVEETRRRREVGDASARQYLTTSRSVGQINSRLYRRAHGSHAICGEP